MFAIYIKIILIGFMSLTFLACDREVVQKINLQKFLPFEGNTTKYTFKVIGKEQGNTFFTEYILKSKHNNCAAMDTYVWTDSKGSKSIKKRTIDTLFCVENNKIVGNNKYIYYSDNKKWYVDIASIQASKVISKAKCNLLSYDKKNIFLKDREVLHTQCKYQISDMSISNDYYMAEGLGLYKMTSELNSKQFNDSTKISVIELINIE